MLTTVYLTWNHLFNRVFNSLVFKYKKWRKIQHSTSRIRLVSVLSIGNKFKDPFS